jgi:hypothetical protein
MRKYYLFLLLFLAWPGPVTYAQLDNRALEKKLDIKPEYDQEIRLGIDVLGFHKNNEYFNDIADGYTFFGYQLNPKLVYFPAAFVRIEAGAFLWQDFGTTRFHQVRPTFTIKVQKPHYQLLFGNLQGHVSHRYIEPLYDLEKVIQDPLENGLQFIWQRDKLWLDAWIDWEKMIYPRDPFREEISGGISAEQRLLETAHGWRLSLPLQFTAQHKGGQIDTSPLPLLTVFNGAAGFRLQKKIDHFFWKNWRTENYYLVFKDFSNEFQLPFKQGQGIYLNAGIDTRVQNLMLSYWKGNGYLTEHGGKLFQSASTTVTHPDYREKERQLLILRFSHDMPLAEDLSLTLRLEPLYDFTNPQLEFSGSLYMHFNTDFFLARRMKAGEVGSR